MEKFIIGEKLLTTEDVYKIASNKEIEVILSDKAVEKIKKSREFVEKLVRENKVVYGLTTGFGKFKDVFLGNNKEKIEQLQINLIRSHSVGVGEPFSEEEVRAAMLVRINSLAMGYSGVRLELIRKLLEMLNKGIYPYVPQQGSVGSSGDLAPLSHLMLVLVGEGEIIENGKRVPAEEGLKKYDFEPFKLSFKEGLALNNGTAFLASLAALNVERAKNLIEWADVSLAMTLEALKGTLDAFSEEIQRLKPYPGQIESAKKVVSLCEGSQLVGPGNDYSDVQDSYSLRCSPQVHGTVVEALSFAKRMVEIEINSSTDNPLIFPEREKVLSGGNFHGEPISLTMDSLSIAIAELANISERRIAKLVDPANNKELPAFLIPKEKAGLSSGFMIAQYTAASLVAENKVLAHPVACDSVPTSANQEDYVSFGTIASRKCRDIISNTEKIISIELLAAAQGLDFRKPKLPGKGVYDYYKKIRELVPFLDNDRILYKDIDNVGKLISLKLTNK